MIQYIAPLAMQLIRIADKAIEDKTERLRFQQQVVEQTFQFYRALLEARTTPWVDGLVKLVLALKGLFRPVFGAAALAYVAWLNSKGISLPPWVEVALSALLPGWFVSRGVEKAARSRKQPPWEFDDDDF